MDLLAKRDLRRFTELCRVFYRAYRHKYFKRAIMKVRGVGPLPVRRFDAFIRHDGIMGTHIRDLKIGCWYATHEYSMLMAFDPLPELHKTINVIELHTVLRNLPKLESLIIVGHQFTGDPSRFVADHQISLRRLTLAYVGFWTHVDGLAPLPSRRSAVQCSWFSVPYNDDITAYGRRGVPNVFAQFISGFSAISKLQIGHLDIMPVVEDMVYQKPYASAPSTLPALHVQEIALPDVGDYTRREDPSTLTFQELVLLLDECVTIHGVEEITRPSAVKFVPAWQDEKTVVHDSDGIDGCLRLWLGNNVYGQCFHLESASIQTDQSHQSAKNGRRKESDSEGTDSMYHTL